MTTNQMDQSLLPPIFSPPRFHFSMPKQPDGEAYVLNSDFNLAMQEIERLNLVLLKRSAVETATRHEAGCECTHCWADAMAARKQQSGEKMLDCEECGGTHPVDQCPAEQQ